MLNKEGNKKIEEVVREFFTKMGFNVVVASAPVQEKTLFIKIETDAPQILIGENGRVLADAQSLLNKIFRKQGNIDFYVDIDINSYKERKIEYLKDMANAIADEVVRSKKDRTLDPMTAYERRIVHLELAPRIDVKTESSGEKDQRSISIKLVV